jgi:hypothetical protein
MERSVDLDSNDTSHDPELPEKHRGTVFTMSADIEALEKQRKVARFRHFEFYCDEPPVVGGEDKYPQPLTYLAAAIGF